jgi:hypothetical protein
MKIRVYIAFREERKLKFRLATRLFIYLERGYFGVRLHEITVTQWHSKTQPALAARSTNYIGRWTC